MRSKPLTKFPVTTSRRSASELNPHCRLFYTALFYIVIVVFTCTLVVLHFASIRGKDTSYQTGTIANEYCCDEVETRSVDFPNNADVDLGNTNSYLNDDVAQDQESQVVPASGEELAAVVPLSFPEPANPIVAFYADSQSDTDEEDQNHQEVVDNILGTTANPIFHAGDLMEDGTMDSLNRFNTVTATLRATRTFYATLGNNDRTVDNPDTPSQWFLDNFDFPNNEQWYSVNYGNLHLVVLDSAFSADDQTQLNWLSTDLLSANSQNRITGIMFHYPTFASTISQKLYDLGVDFVVSGHNHAYSHSILNGIHYFVLSGQPTIGYLVAEIYSDQVLITAYDYNNSTIETVLFNERTCSYEKCTDDYFRTLFPNQYN